MDCEEHSFDTYGDDEADLILAKELNTGGVLARALVVHMYAMGAASCKIPVIYEDCKYVVTVAPVGSVEE